MAAADWVRLNDPNEDDEVSNDAMQLMTMAIFNGLCHLIRELAGRGLMDTDRLLVMHDAMTSPLDDEACRDDDFLISVAETLDEIFGIAMRNARSGLSLDRS